MDLNDGVQCNWPTAAAGLFFAEALQRGKLRAEAKGACVRALEILEATQQEDGGWRVDFASYSPAAELEWRGYMTVRALTILRRNGAI